MRLPSLLVVCLVICLYGRHHVLAAVPGSGVPEIPTVLEGETAPSESAPDDSYAEEMEEIKIITGVLSYGSIAPQNPPSQAKKPGGKPAKAPKKVKPKDYMKTVLKDSGKIALKSTEKHAAKYGNQILDDVVTGNFKDAAGAVKEMGTTSPKLAKHIGQELGKNAILRAQQIDFGWSRRRLLAAPGSGVAEIPTVLEGASSSSNAPGSSDNSNVGGAHCVRQQGLPANYKYPMLRPIHRPSLKRHWACHSLSISSHSSALALRRPFPWQWLV